MEERYIMEILAEIKGQKEIEKITRALRDFGEQAEKVTVKAKGLSNIKFDLKGREIRTQIAKLESELTGKTYAMKIKTVISPEGRELYKSFDIKKLENLTAKFAQIPAPKNLTDWKKTLTSTSKDFANLSEILSADLKEMTNKAGVTAKQFAVVWKDKAGREYKTFVKGVVKGNNLVNVSMRTVPKTMREISRSANTGVSSVNDFVKALKRVLIVVPIWFAFRRVFTSTLSLIRSSVKFLIDWEQQMAQIRIVGKGTEEELSQLSGVLLSLSKNLGISTKQLGRASVLWAQQGRSISEIIPLMESTARLSLITGRTMSQSVEDLTAIMKAYKLESADTGRVIDSITGVMLKHAVTTNVLVEAMKSVAPVAKQFNISFEEMLGILTATHAVTRIQGSTLGKAFRTIFARMATTATTAIQEIAKVPVFLDKEGKVTDVTTYKMRNLGQILMEVALKWNTLTQAQKINLAQAMAGKRRLTELMALMNNYDEALQAHIDALLSIGKADRSVSILTDTLANRLEALSGAWKQFTQEVGNTGFMKGTVNFLTGLLQGLTRLIDPVKADYNKFSNEISNANKKLQRQIGLANAQLQIWQETKRMASFFAREPKLAKKLESKYVYMYVEALKQAGIEIKGNITSMKQLASFMEGQIPKATEEMAKAIHEQGINKIKMQIMSIGMEIQKLTGTIASETRRQLDFGFLGTSFSKTTTEYAKLYRDLQEKMKKGLPLSTQEIEQIKVIFKNTSKTEEEYLAKMKLITRYQLLINKLKKEENNYENALLEAKAKVSAITKQETTQMITAQEARRKLAEIEKEALATNEDRLVTDKKMLAFLQNENIAMDDSLRKRKESLEKEILRIQAQRKINLLKQEESLILERMKIAGATTLQLEIQRMQLMKERGATEYELAQQSMKIQQTMMQEIEQSASTLKSAFSDAFSEMIKGEEKMSTILDELMNKIRGDIANTMAESLTNQIYQMTDIGNLYGQSLMKIKYPNMNNMALPQQIQQSYATGANYTYEKILRAHLQGANRIAQVLQVGFQSFQPTRQGLQKNLVGSAGTLPFVSETPLVKTPAQIKQPTGFWGSLTPKSALLSFGLGAFAGMKGGVVNAVSSGLSSLFLATGHPLLALGSLLFGGLFRKKKVITQETPKQIAGQQPLNLGIQVPGLPKTYALPQSFYFNASINVNIDKVQGEGTEIADKIASEVAKATEQAFKQSYVRNITRAVLPKTVGF